MVLPVPLRRNELTKSCRRVLRTNDHDVELETTLEKLLLNLGGNRVETDIALEDGLL